MIQRAGKQAGIPFVVHVHMLCHSCGHVLASKGVDTRITNAPTGLLAPRSFASNRSVRVTVQVLGSVLRILGCVLCGNGEPLLIRSMIWPTSPKLSQIPGMPRAQKCLVSAELFLFLRKGSASVCWSPSIRGGSCVLNPD